MSYDTKTPDGIIIGTDDEDKPILMPYMTFEQAVAYFTEGVEDIHEKEWLWPSIISHIARTTQETHDNAWRYFHGWINDTRPKKREDTDPPPKCSRFIERLCYGIIRTIEVEAKVAKVTTGGNRAFYSPSEWRALGYEVGDAALLVVSYDGGMLAPFFNHSYQAYPCIDAMTAELAEMGVYAEGYNCYSVIYPRRVAERTDEETSTFK